MITIFKDILTTNEPYYRTAKYVYNRIQSDIYKSKILELRKLKDKKDRDKIKQTLPSICWSGIFSKRGNDFIDKHSGLVCIDFDHLNDLEVMKKRLCDDQYTYMCFISPSGDGLKLIMKIPDNISNHADSCRAITQYFADDRLDEFRDIARVCYISYDPDIYINEDSKVFTKLLKDKPKNIQVFYPTERVTETNDIFDRIVKWLDKKDSYQDGNKHSYLVKLSSACLRFGIPQFECSSRLYFDFGNRASQVKREDIEKIVSIVYRNYSNTACTAHFEQSGKPIYTATKQEVKQDIFDIELTEKDIIYLDNVRQSMFEGFKTGKAKGETTYFKSFDEHWTWRRKEITFVGGIGNAGKSTMLNNLCVLRAINDGWKFAFFSPEQDPPDDFYNDLIHTYVGKSTEPFHHNQMTEDQYKEAMKFIEQHFFYIYPESASPTPEYINTCFELAIKKHDVDVCVVDPFNQLDNDWKKHNRDDLYISEFLSKCKRFSQDKNIAYMIAGHPKGNLQRVSGNYDIPQVYDYAGGAMWNNKCDNILCYHRPYAITQPANTECMFISQKIKKRKLTGIPGTSKMVFDIFTNRFIEEDGNDPFVNDQKGVIYDNSDLSKIDNDWTNQESRELPF